MKPIFFKKQIHYLFFFYIYLLSLKSLNSQNIEGQFNGTSIKYSVLVDLKQYLENEKNIDNRTIYSRQNITLANLGILKGTYFNKSNYPSVNDQYETFDELIADLKDYKIDAIIADAARGNETGMFSNEIDRIGSPVFFPAGFGYNKNSNLKSKIDNIVNEDYYSQEAGIRKWFGFAFLNGYYIDKELEGDTELNVAMQLKHPIFSFKDEDNNNEPVGAEVDLIYSFARANNYTVNLMEVDTYDEQVEMLKNGNADIAGGNFIQRFESEITEYVDFAYIHPSVLAYLIRYENSPKSLEWSNYYEKWEDLDGKVLGVMPASTFLNITKENFPNYIPLECPEIFDLFERLLLDDIEGFLVDEPVAEYFSIKFPERITYFEKDFYTNEYGFAFSNDNDNLVNQFNEFLSEINPTEIYDQWMNNPSSMTIDTDLDTNNPTIKVALYLAHKPLSYREGKYIKGYEVDLIYRFAKAKSYNIELEECTLEERISLIQNNEVNITGGILTITEERKKIMNFSNPTFEGGTVLVVRTNTKKDKITLKIIGEDNKEKEGNKAEIIVKFPNGTKTSNCVFPEKYNDTILVNCEITDLSGISSYSEGFTLDSSKNNLKVMCLNYKLDNLIKANTLLNKEIITEATEANEPSNNNYNNTQPQIKKKSGGLSTGGIVAIVVPCSVVLIGATALVFGLTSSKPAAVASDPSLTNQPINNMVNA